ncbi:MMPL family transporter [Bifidobacterium sp. 82T24]|uniref:MMPL family transporter n=1 Tax=Bifidobacterium pluvialisilvae TaxID=2834436 RepID=UPI001C55DFB6|nr:MMPL family transporter [Bifidobacterium pluvialisilvae]MBW3088216.1 MMPL family transporter [Bifidobacterium pluvialisilvae]
MSSILYRLGRLMSRRRRTVFVAWLLVLVLAVTSMATMSKGTNDEFAIPGSESQSALDHLKHVFPEVSGTSAQIVVVTPDGKPVDTPANRTAVGELAERIGDYDQVALAADPFSDTVKDAVSEDGRAAIVAIQFDVPVNDLRPETKARIESDGEWLRQRLGDGTEVHVGGSAFSNAIPALSPTEGVGLLIALVVLLLTFGSMIAAGMPLLTAIIGVGVAVASIYAATAWTTISSTAPMLAVMLGLAVGIDYALFLISRHRDQLTQGLDVEESVARSVATAGSAVIFAGLTVVIALLGLSVAGIPFLTTMGLAAAFGVTVAVAVAETLVPALMASAGERLRPRTRAGRETSRHRPANRFARFWVRMATARPLATVVVIVAALAAMSVPAGQLRLALPDNGVEETGTPARSAYDAIGEHFGPGFNGPLIVTADIIQSTDPIGLVNDLADEIRAIPGVKSVPLATPNPKGDTGIIQIVPETGPSDPRTERLVQTLRDKEAHFADKYDTQTAVTGITAVAIDVSAKLGGALLPFGMLVAGLSLVLLAMVFRSIWVPVKATVGYLLSVLAAFGATSWVFQLGHGADLIGVQRVGSVISFLPIILMGVLFGLAMDYEVFLVSRIREHYARHGDARAAITEGFAAASRVVVAAATIMFAVFAAFIPEGSATIKPIAFSLAVGVFVDAFIVRLTFVPAVLALLGKRAWHLPAAIDRRLPVFDAEGDGLSQELRLRDWPAPDSHESISAARLSADDDRGTPLFENLDVHVPDGGVLVIEGAGVNGKSALLCTLAGRVTTFRGDLKVLGRVLPQHAGKVRQAVVLVGCANVPGPLDAVDRALADHARIVFLDDADAVLYPGARTRLREMVAARAAGAAPVTYVMTCQNAAQLADILPADGVTILSMGAAGHRRRV